MTSIDEKLNAHREQRINDMGELATVEPEELSVSDIHRFNSYAVALRRNDPMKYMAIQRKLMVAFYQSQMIPGQDYGKIEGCGEKPALFKAGAEKAATFFNYSIHVSLEKDHEDWDKEMFSYSYKATVRDASNRPLAECVGNCNSKESKYRWRSVSEKYATEEQKKSAVSKFKSKKGYLMLKVPNDDICSQVNTLHKMAQKRAIVGAVLLATNCSAFFGNAEQEVANASKEIPDHPSWDTIDAEVVEESSHQKDWGEIMKYLSINKGQLIAIAKKASLPTKSTQLTEVQAEDLLEHCLVHWSLDLEKKMKIQLFNADKHRVNAINKVSEKSDSDLNLVENWMKYCYAKVDEVEAAMDAQTVNAEVA